MDGEARKWSRDILVGSINEIYSLEGTFMRQWGETKDFLYYITKFRALKRKLDELVIDFTK